MVEYLICTADNCTNTMFNVKFENCTKAEAIKNFRELFNNDVIVNIIEL